MKIIFLQELKRGLLGGLLKGLFTRAPTVAVLLLTVVVAACGGDSKSSGPTGNQSPVFTEDIYVFNLDLSMANAEGFVVGNVSAMDAQGTPFDYSLTGNGDLFENLFELAAANNVDNSRNIILSRAAILSDFATSSVTFQVNAIHQGDSAILSGADITVNFNNDLSFDDDSDLDGIKGFYDASPHDATTNVTGNGESGTPYIISNIYQLQAIAGVDHTGTALGSSSFTNNGFLYGADAADQLTKHYILASNINASATADTVVWIKPVVSSYIGHGWTPIAGKDGQSFSGSFNGDGYAISNLNMTLIAAATTDTFGLFGTNSGNISAVGLQNINMIVQAKSNFYLGLDAVRRTRTDNIVSTGSHAGGLVGLNQEDGIISYSYATGLVNASMDAIGGLVGLNQGEISYSYSTAVVQGEGDTGGLVGTNEPGVILSSYATGDVRGHSGIRYRTGTAGGLAGSISGGGAIINTSYATGMVSDATPAEGTSLGGVVAERDDDRDENSAGRVNVTIDSSYWDSDTTSAPNGVGKDRERTRNTGDQTGTFSFTTGQLRGCGLAGMPTSDTTCAPLFPSANWGNTTIMTTDGDIERGWIFNADEYPSLSAVRSDNKQLLPSSAEQECQRNGMPLGC